MSKNFELMLRGGKSWEVAPAVTKEKPEKIERPRAVVPIRKKHWDGRRRKGRLNIDRLAQEEFFQLIQRVFFLQTQTPHVVVFAGVDHGNGCSRICAQAAEALEVNGRGPVCLVDANFRSPSLSRVYNMSNHHGLADSLFSEDPILRETSAHGPALAAIDGIAFGGLAWVAQRQPFEGSLRRIAK
jgi:Mrp family chromosome partitioning ATPase